MGYFEEARWLVLDHLDHRENTEIFQNMVEALVLDHHPSSNFFQRIHNILKNAGRKSLLLEKFRKFLVKQLVKTKFGRAMAQTHRSHISETNQDIVSSEVKED